MCSLYLAGPPLALGIRREDVEEEEDHADHAERAVLRLIDLDSTLTIGLLRGELLEDSRVLGLRSHRLPFSDRLRLCEGLVVGRRCDNVGLGRYSDVRRREGPGLCGTQRR